MRGIALASAFCVRGFSLSSFELTLLFHVCFALFAGRPCTPPSRIETSMLKLAGSLLRQLGKLFALPCLSASRAS
jgi:hypothetical protein